MMEDMEKYLKKPATFTLAKLEKMLVVIGEVDIGPIPSTITPITQVAMVYFCVYLVLLVMLMIVFTKIKDVIVGVMVQYVEVGLKISATIPLTNIDKVFMVMGEAYIGIKIAPLPPIIQVILLGHGIL